MEPGNGRHAKFLLRQMGLLGQHNQVILLSIATANGAEDGFIDFNQLAVNSSSVIKHEIRNISTLLVEAEVLGKTLVYSGRHYSIL